MKALIISDKQDVIKLLSKRLEKEGFDIIVYRWLLKALDNVEEIRPDFIILSVEEYPRHWKTLASFVQSGIGGNDVRFCLYKDELLSEDDRNKAEQLGVEFYSELREIAVEQDDEPEEDTKSESVPTVEDVFTDNKQNVEEIKEDYSVIITNPITGKFIYGTAIQQSFDSFDCYLNAENFSIDEKVNYVTICNSNNCISFSGEVKSVEIDAEYEKVSLKVLNYYEK